MRGIREFSSTGTRILSTAGVVLVIAGIQGVLVIVGFDMVGNRYLFAGLNNPGEVICYLNLRSCREAKARINLFQLKDYLSNLQIR